MEQGRDDLWQGGPWEQPSPVFVPPPEVIIPRKKKKTVRRGRRKRFVLFGAMLLCVCVLAGTQGVRYWQAHRPAEGLGEDFPAPVESEHSELPTLPQAPTGTGVTVDIAPLPEQELSYSQVYEKNQNSIVTVHVIDRRGMSQGTGIVLTEDGYVITNAHVVEGAAEAAVILSNDMVYPASLVGSSTKEDLAVLKIEAEGLTAAEFGDSGLLKVGDAVSALGSPLGYRMSLTSGIVSAMDRELKIDGTSMYLIQTNAAINFGNSGGALFNDRGQVVGVTTAKIVAGDGSTEALGFAIPTERVKYVVDHLIAGEEIRTPALGITVQYDPGSMGLTVAEIQPWSDAVEQGLAVGDVITAVDGIPVTTSRTLERIKNLRRVGDRLQLQILREEQQLEFSVLLQDWEQLYDQQP